MIHIQKKFPKATCWSSVVPWGNRGLAELYKVGSKMITFFAYSQCLGIMRRPVFYRVVYSKHQKKKKKGVLFITGDWNAKVGSQEIDTWSNRQVWPWSTE